MQKITRKKHKFLRMKLNKRIYAPTLLTIGVSQSTNMELIWYSNSGS